MAAQYQALRTNWMKDNIERSAVSPSRRVCSGRGETINLIVLECKCLAQNEYKKMAL